MTDPVNHPAHYTEHPSGIECIQITEHMGFNLGNAVKYIWRADLKGSAIEDLEKARWYIDRELTKRDALFPATEPAEEAPNLAAVAQEPRRFDPADECQNDNHDPGCTCGAQHWMTTPAPAEPAEEETKAEHNASVARREALGRVAQQLYEQSFDGCDGTFYHDFGRALEDFLPSQGWTRIPASSPVVPPPTETGPWQNVDAIQVGVPFEDKEGSQLVKLADGKFGYLSYPRETPETLAKYAPFVAAAEEG